MISLGATVLSHHNISPKIPGSAFIAPGVRIIGDVILGEYAGIWYNTVIRGDVYPITIGDETNIQDGCVLHVTKDKFPLSIANRVTVGHSVTLHGCTVESESLVGIGSTVLDGAVIHTHSMVAAGALVPPGMEVPTGYLVGGIPAKIMRELTPEEIKYLSHSADNYRQYAQEHMELLSQANAG